ncbi:MAG: TrkA family potassium uptake protein [Planctomycetes bacterium]|nr:TrkA family potassium uptake protein [Planctomycetota bacterium]
MKCAVIGLGQFGKAAALALARNGVEVIGVDEDMELVDDIKDEISLAVRMDATDEGSLESHGIGQVNVLVAAIGANFEAQVLTVVYAKKLGIPKVVARAMTPVHARILHLVGADEILNPEEEAANRLVQRLLIPGISGYFELAESFSVVEIDAPAGTVGKSLLQLDLRRKFRINLVAIKHRSPNPDGTSMREEFNPVPSPDDRIRFGDVLALVGSDLDLASFMAEFSAQ